MSIDPLAGKREAINRGESHRLLWPDVGAGSPVAVGETFELRSCSIEITRAHRVQKGRRWYWRAEFSRLVPYKPNFLARSLGSASYTDDPNQALRSQDDFANAPTLDSSETLLDRNLQTPPEPEAIPKHEVDQLPTSVAAYARYRQLHDADIQKRLDRSMTSKLREVRIRARAAGVDVSEEMDAITEATERARRKIKAAA